MKVLEYLVEYGGADVNFRTNFGNSGSPLRWTAISSYNDHPMIDKLKSCSVKFIAPTYEQHKQNKIVILLQMIIGMRLFMLMKIKLVSLISSVTKRIFTWLLLFAVENVCTL